MSITQIFAVCALCALSGCWLTNAEVQAKYAAPTDTADTGTADEVAEE